MDKLTEAYLSVYENVLSEMPVTDEGRIYRKSGSSAPTSPTTRTPVTTTTKPTTRTPVTTTTKPTTRTPVTTTTKPTKKFKTTPTASTTPNAAAERRAELRAQITGMKEEFDSYDVVLEYLLDEGYADTEENAITIMANMSEVWIDEIIDEAKVDAGLSDDEKRTARSERGTVGYMHPLTRGDKKKKKGKDSSSTGIHGKYFQMQHTKRENQKGRDADVQRERDRGAMSRGTWDRD